MGQFFKKESLKPQRFFSPPRISPASFTPTSHMIRKLGTEVDLKK